MITGGTGFLGRALTEEILKFEPRSIRLFSRDEVKHHNVQELFSYNEKLRNLIGDVRDYPRIRRATEGVDIVIHAAALKRLDILEYNVGESIHTNIMGTLNVVNACLENDVEKVIFVSTDKACSPVNTYGACKFVGERIFTESNYNKGNNKTRFISVRYGNVLESTGSVIPFFESKLKNDEEIPLTDPKMTRFIISPKEAVQLIFNSIIYGVGGEIFIPKLPAFKIVDLVEILKEKHGKGETRMKIIGIRPGEKIHELMVNNSEVPRTYDFKNMFVISPIIETYKPTEKIEWMEGGNKLDENSFTEYSSNNAVIPKEQVRTLLSQLGVI